MILELQVTGTSARAQDSVSSPFSSCLSTFLGERFFCYCCFCWCSWCCCYCCCYYSSSVSFEMQEFLFCSLLVVNAFVFVVVVALVVFVTAFVIAFLPSQQMICKIVWLFWPFLSILNTLLASTMANIMINGESVSIFQVREALKKYFYRNIS